MGSVWRALLQVVRIPAILMHCHSTPRLALEIGSGCVNPPDRTAAAQASAKTEIMSASLLWIHHAGVMAITPVTAPIVQ